MVLLWDRYRILSHFHKCYMKHEILCRIYRAATLVALVLPSCVILQESITGRTPNENPGSRHKETDNVK